ncbi:MAG: type IV secretion system DNA-binding domain-containing protein [Candidatus Vogelbacteria bacterium]|nr:type IV secretion system DNA-binding domain-containing protein [Candidatus Vogelbacteria bacterium]
MAEDSLNSEVAYFAETDFRGKKTRFGIKNGDRARHFYVIGKTGMGKSTLLENMAIQDIQSGRGLAFVDPHGETAEKLLDYVPPARIKDVIYFAPFDLDYPISFNVMEDVGKDQRHLVANGLMSAFKKIWVDAWSARMEYILNNTLLALLEYPGSTILGINRMLSDREYRKKVVDNIADPSVKSFWVDEFAKYTERFAAEATPAIQNKVGQFTSNPLIRNIIGQPKSSFDCREIMDQKKILIVNLSKGRMGEGNANLLGSMLITKLYLTAMSRANLSGPELRTLPPFYLFVDEFQSFANESFANILSEARKYKLSLALAHQYIEQMAEEVRAAVFGNVGTIVAFRVGPFDAEVLEKIFFPTFTQEDLVNLGFAQVYLTLMIDGVGSPPFSAVTLPPIPLLQDSSRDRVIEHSRRAYARPRGAVETEIVAWHGNQRPAEPPVKKVAGQSFNSAARVVSLGALKNRPPLEKKVLSATEKEKTKEELRQSLKAIMEKKPPPIAPPPSATVEPKIEPKRNEVPREELEKLLKVD